jgi:hypothetical protein
MSGIRYRRRVLRLRYGICYPIPVGCRAEWRNVGIDQIAVHQPGQLPFRGTSRKRQTPPRSLGPLLSKQHHAAIPQSLYFFARSMLGVIFYCRSTAFRCTRFSRSILHPWRWSGRIGPACSIIVPLSGGQRALPAGAGRRRSAITTRPPHIAASPRLRDCATWRAHPVRAPVPHS